MESCAYYNEHDEFAAEWLRELMAHGLIAPGIVDERSIEDVRAADLKGFTQCHFFAGIGVWSYALRCAGWPDDRPVWTGSCPCQPFSGTGKRKAFHDPRHLWPAWLRLIRERRPDVLFGEQVASSAGLAWLDVVSVSLEDESYAVGAADLPAACVGAPHIRQRLYFVAEPEHHGTREYARELPGDEGQHEVGSAFGDHSSGDRGAARDLVLASGSRLEGHARHGNDGHQSGWLGTRPAGPVAETGATRGFWRDAEWIPCTDGKARPVEPGTFPLAHGTPDRVGRLRGYGNALCAPQAQAFIEAYTEVRGLKR